MNIQVVKRNGAIEDFKHTNIAKVVNAAGLDTVQAEGLAERVEKRLIEKGNPKVSTQDVQTLVLDELTKINPNVAGLYEWYESSKDVQDDLEQAKEQQQ